MQGYSSPEINELEKRFRTQLINGLPGLKGVVLIGTQNAHGHTNLAVFNSFFHVGANPPLLGFVVRPDSVERHTLQNIRETGVYTINSVSVHQLEMAHQTSARYPDEVSEFDACGFTPEYGQNFQAPAVKESAIKLWMHFKEEIAIQSNGTHLIIGSVEHISFPEHAVNEQGNWNFELLNLVACSGLDTYYSIKRLGILSYAKPEKSPLWTEK